MSFPRHPEIYPPMEAQTNAAYAPLIAWMSFRLVIPWRVALPQWDTRPVVWTIREGTVGLS